jgi:Fe-S cluster biosynthesis and repair protein YggX
MLWFTSPLIMPRNPVVGKRKCQGLKTSSYPTNTGKRVLNVSVNGAIDGKMKPTLI